PVSLLAGQRTATGTIAGLATGSAVLTLTNSSLLNSMEAQVYVTTESANANVIYTRALGLVKGDPAVPSTDSTSGPVLSAPLGVIKGDPASYPGATVGPILSSPLGVEKP